MSTSPNEDGRPTQGGAAQPVHVMNPAGSATQPVSGTVNAIITNGTDAATIQTANADGVSNSQNNLTTTSRIMGFNGSTWDRIRTAIGDAMAATGLLALGNMLWNGATWDRWKGDSTGSARVSLYGKVTTAGDTVLLAESVTGALKVAPNNLDGTGLANADGVNTLGYAGLLTNNRVFLFNGATFDRQYNNNEVTALASAARTASINSADLVNYNSRGVIVVVDITTLTATGTLTVTIQGKDTLSGKYYTLLASTLLTATGTTVLVVYPGTTIAANLDANSPLPRNWRVSVVAGNGVSITYSVGCNYIN